MSDISDHRISRKFDLAKAIPLVSAAFAIAAGMVVLIGWEFDIDPFKRLLPHLASMNPMTAICIILSGAAIALSCYSWKRSAFAVALTIAALSMIKIFDLAKGGEPIDQILFTSLLGGDVGPLPNRMAPNTAVALLFTGISLALVQSDRSRARLLSQFFAVWQSLIAMFALLSYGIGLAHFSSVASYIPMALPTAVALVILGVGVLSLSSETGLALFIRDTGPAGSICRTTLPLAVVIPLLSAAFRMWGERYGYYSRDTGIAIQVMSNVVVTATLLMASVVALYRSNEMRQAHERELKDSERLNRLIASANPDCICLLDDEANILFANDALVHAFGFKNVHEIIGSPWGERLDDKSRSERDVALLEAQSFGAGRLSLCFPDTHGAPRWFDTIFSKLPPDNDSQFCFLAMSRDITEKRAVEDQVRWNATHDDLTKLPNRAQFRSQLDQQFEMKSLDGFALLMLDVDNFKLVNDTLGHDAGDVLLCTVAKRVAKAVREGDFVARLAGDEFAVIMRGVRTEAAAIAIAERIFDGLREPWIYNGRLADCRVSIGASIATRHGSDSAELLKNADIALYVAKASGKNQLAVFQPGMKVAFQKRTNEMELARNALRQDLIIPHYQPLIDLSNGRVAGFEALLRWRSSRGGIQMPSTIIGAFDDFELAGEITERMLCHVLWDMTRWLNQGLEFGHVAINVTAADLKQGDFAERLLARLDSQNIPHSCLQVEVTETVFLGRGAEYVERALTTLHAHGIRVALDDFGTGYASLSHLNQFPVDIVKIDRSFLANLKVSPQNDTIIKTVISLGHSLNIEIIAEGIETLEQQQYLISRGCGFGQGYFYGKAMPAMRIPKFIKASHHGDRRAA